MNPKKSIFAVLEGKTLGHIISKKGISINPKRVEVSKIPLPHNKKGMQLFMGTINFVWKYVPDFEQIVKPLQQMVKKSMQFKSTDVEKVAFNDIKTTTAHAPSLKSLDFENDLVFSFTLYVVFLSFVKWTICHNI